MRIALRLATAATAATLAIAAPAAANPFAWTGHFEIGPSGSPFGSTTHGAPCQNAPDQSGTNYPGTEVEPWLAVNPANPDNQIVTWQQDRWSNGGANALLFAYSVDGGRTWTTPPVGDQPKFSYCTGGSGATGGYTRASDPWVTFSPNGYAWGMALQADIGVPTSNHNGMSVARSTDGGRTWEDPINLREDFAWPVLNDKNSITADRFDSDYVYAIWDRLVTANEHASQRAAENAIGYHGPTWFSRTTNGASARPTWETAHPIYDPGTLNQTIGNQIVQTGTGTLVDAFTLIFNAKNAHGVRGYNIAVLRSADRGATWSSAKIVTKYVPGTVPGLRTGDIIPEVAVDPRAGSDTLYIAYQDGSTGTSRIMLTKSTDGGIDWTTPTPINTDTSVPAFTPAIKVDPRGTVTVTYYDLRNATGASPYLTDSWSLHSHDGGTTFTEDHLSGPFDQSSAAVARGYFLGDYEALGSDEDPAATPANAFFTSGRVQTDADNPSDDPSNGFQSSHTYGSRTEDTGP